MRALPLLLLLFLTVGLTAQATSYISGGTCRNIGNCSGLTDQAGDSVWVNYSYIVFNGQTCSTAVQYQFSDPNPLDKNGVIYSEAFQCPDNSTIAVILKGYEYYKSSSGGRAGGGSGWRWAITSGSAVA